MLAWSRSVNIKFSARQWEVVPAGIAVERLPVSGFTQDHARNRS